MRANAVAGPAFALSGGLRFELTSALEAREPPEARGLARDEVRLMVSHADDDTIVHTRFRELPGFLQRGDLLVVNTSATINAAIDAWRVQQRGQITERILLHLSTALDGGRWAIELRRLTASGHEPLFTARVGERIRLRGGGSATLIVPCRPGRGSDPPNGRVRLWIAELDCDGGVLAYAAVHGSPIRYPYLRDRWPLAYYQTVFAREAGSAEMPSAGRAFTTEIVSRLSRRGVRIAPLVLHTGVASLEADEAPYPERFRIPGRTAAAVNAARRTGGRIIAVGTTVVRALETVASPDGQIRSAQGWTDLVVTPDRGVRVVDAIITGFHEPRASHLAMLEAIAGRRHLTAAYESALATGYLWHEFGDVHLIFGQNP